ncbi:MAG: S8 family serine peptidase [Gaiellales bacterium]
MNTSRLLALVAIAGATATAVVATGSPATRPGANHTAVGLTAAATAFDLARLRAAGGAEIDHRLRLWSLPQASPGTIASLRRRGALAFSARVRHYVVSDVAPPAPDPLLPAEWWRSVVGADRAVPPGPGVPVTVVDSGVSVGHPEFVDRPDLTVLNPQEPAPVGGVHGTMVSSVVGAPSNGVGTVGIYPRAALRSWDTALGDGSALDSVEIARGVLAAARAGRGVINLSLGGGPDPVLALAIEEAVGRGSLVVAASGNEGAEGSPRSYPAVLPHVVTVAATGRDGSVTSFSSRSPYVDLAAPGDGIVVASALTGSWEEASGTSFSAPIVSGAAAWLWTMRPELDAGQVAEILRRSARDIGLPGRDTATGFGMLDLPAALAAPTPRRDPFEPNDRIANVIAGNERNLVRAPGLTAPGRTSTTLVARVDRYEDPVDLYRVWIPARRRLALTLRTTGENDLLLSSGRGPLSPRTRSQGGRAQLLYVNNGPARVAYVGVTATPAIAATTYALSTRIG